MFVCHIAGRRQTSRQKWPVDVRSYRAVRRRRGPPDRRPNGVGYTAVSPLSRDVLAPHGIKCTRRTATLTVRARGGGLRQRSRGAWKGWRGMSGGTYVLLLWVLRPFRRFARRHLYVDCATIDVIFCPFSGKTNRTAKDDVRPADDLNTKSEPPVDIPLLDLVSCVFVFVRTDGASGAGEKPRCPPNTWPPPFCRGGGVMFLLLLWSSYSDKLMGSR